MEEDQKKKKGVLVTFDIDGTLIRSTGPNSNQLHRQAFVHAFLQVFGIDGTIDAIQHHGSTDPAILVNTLVHYCVPSDVAVEKLPVLKLKMIEYAKDNAKDIGEGLEVLPGVESLLHALSSMDNVFVGLVTGKLEGIAWMKMEGLGIEKYFSVPHFGTFHKFPFSWLIAWLMKPFLRFGSDHIDRGHLVKTAAERAENFFLGDLICECMLETRQTILKQLNLGELWQWEFALVSLERRSWSKLAVEAPLFFKIFLTIKAS